MNIQTGGISAGTKAYWVLLSVYKLKTDESGDLMDHKSRLMAQGFSQKYRIDYTNTFALVAQTNLLRVLLVLGVHFDWEIY